MYSPSPDVGCAVYKICVFVLVFLFSCPFRDGFDEEKCGARSHSSEYRAKPLTSFLALGAKQVLRPFLPRTMYKGPRWTYGVRVGPCWHLSDQIYHSFFFLPFFFLFWWTTGQRVLLVGLTPSNFEVVCCT